MDWRTLTFDWNRARAFLVTVEEGSLSAAARALGIAQPTLGRQVAALEKELGVALFERTGRGLTPTPAGLDLADHVRAMGEAATRFSLAASGQTQALEGPISIAASEIYAAFVLPPALAILRRTHPGISVEIVASNSLQDLRRREADIAIRNARPTQPDLIARRLPDDSARLYASPDLLDRLGAPGTPAELAGAEFLGFEDRQRMIDGLNALGFALTLADFPIVTENHLVQLELARRGLGIGIFPTAVGDADPALRQVLPSLPPISFPVWLTAHRDVATSRRLRTVFDLLAAQIGGARTETTGASPPRP